jgi:hypothetical protein
VPALVEQHVARLDVAVDEVAAVRVGEPLGHLGAEPSALGFREPVFAPQARP